MTHLIMPYCERLTSAAEPVNIASNIAFVVVSAVCLRQSDLYFSARLFAFENWRRLVLAALLLAIATGSVLFHWRPGHVTQALDILPIGLFTAFSAYLIIRQQLQWSLARTHATLLIWLAATIAFSSWPAILGGTLFYFPTWFLLFYLQTHMQAQRQLAWQVLGLFALALLIRSLDLPLCSRLPIGTHALWHLTAAAACAQITRLAWQRAENPGTR